MSLTHNTTKYRTYQTTEIYCSVTESPHCHYSQSSLDKTGLSISTNIKESLGENILAIKCIHYARFEVLSVVTIKYKIFCNIAPCGLVNGGARVPYLRL